MKINYAVKVNFVIRINNSLVIDYITGIGNTIQIPVTRDKFPKMAYF